VLLLLLLVLLLFTVYCSLKLVLVLVLFNGLSQQDRKENPSSLSRPIPAGSTGGYCRLFQDRYYGANVLLFRYCITQGGVRLVRAWSGTLGRQARASLKRVKVIQYV